jgi:hypothetical protein
VVLPRGRASASVLVALGVALLVLAGCASTGQGQAAPASSGTRHGTVTKVLVVIVENHSLDQMRTGMPYIYGLATRYGYADQYRAITHPSLPNYLAIAGGSTFGVTDDENPVAHVIHGSSVFGQALAQGRTAAVYAEGMPLACSSRNGGDRYAVRHNPWTYFVDERDACVAHDVPLDRLAADAASGHLPNVGMVVPNLCNDAHDCSLATADSWMRTNLRAVLAGPDYRAGRLAVVITADEDDHSHGNVVLTAVLQPSLHGLVVHAPLTHYSLSRSLSEVTGAAPMAEAAKAPSLLAAFGLA